jgi:tRNA(Ile2) C34 agmatinyltransferase TiaS
MSAKLIRYDKSTTVMDAKEQMYWMHFLKGDPIIGDYIRSQMRQNPTFRRELFDQPVCPRCEKFCFYHKGGAQCPSCGHWTPENQTHKVKIHLAEGHYR